MYEDVKQKIKRKNKIFFSRESACLQPLIELICKQKHRTLVLWALDFMKDAIDELQDVYPNEQRFQECYDLCYMWAQGKVKMPLAKRAILNAHAVAKEIDNPVHIALCHAIGQAGGTVHVETHALGFVFYELTAIVLKNENWEEAVTQRIHEYEEKLQYYQDHIDEYNGDWAKFLLDDTRENKELVMQRKLWEKKHG